MRNFKWKNKKKKLSKNGTRGITLIALVITIIVLLILAAVSIATLTGKNGILTKAQTAQGLTKQENAKEKVQVEVLGSLDNSGDIDLSVLNKNLEHVEGITQGTPIESLPAELTVDGCRVKIDGNGKVTVEGEVAENPTDPPKTPTFENVNTAETNPAGSMPTGATVVEENGKELNDANEGIVIKDTNNNEWVWIEVPKSQMPTGLTFTNETGYSEEDQAKCDSITAALKIYADPYTKGSADQIEDPKYNNWTDEWYDKLGTTYDGENEYSEIKYITSTSKFTEAKEYYGTIYKNNIETEEATSYESGTKYYAKITEKLNDVSGCGLTLSEYKETYQKMIKSVYNNGGFWIGRYEAGIDGTTESAEEKSEILELGRTQSNQPRIDVNNSPKAISQKDAIPYNFVYCSEAQKLVSKMTPDSNKISSLLFGIQWDLVCKFIEEKEVKEQGESRKASIIATINLDSGEWGNYINKTFSVNSTNGKCAIASSTNNYGATATWQKVPENYTKPAVTGSPEGVAIFSAGVMERNKKLNIYDFAGNEYEWTLEHATAYASSPCSRRGGGFNGDSTDSPASFRNNDYTTGASYNNSFRPALY